MEKIDEEKYRACRWVIGVNTYCNKLVSHKWARQGFPYCKKHRAGIGIEK